MLRIRLHDRVLQVMLVVLLPFVGFAAQQHHTHLEADAEGTRHVHGHMHSHAHGHKYACERTGLPVEHDHQPVENLLHLFSTVWSRFLDANDVLTPGTNAQAIDQPCLATVPCAPTRIVRCILPFPRPASQSAELRRAANLSPPLAV
jgi:hypothetical protein